MNLIRIPIEPPPENNKTHVLSSAQGTFSRTGHMIGYKTSSDEFKIEITSRIFCDHSVMRLEVNYKEKTATHPPPQYM